MLTRRQIIKGGLAVSLYSALPVKPTKADIAALTQYYNSATSSGFDTTNITFWWRCEAADFSGTNGTLDYSAGDDVATLNSSAAINTSAVKNGTNGLDIPSAWDYALFTPSSIVSSAEGRVGFWLKINTFGLNDTIWGLNYDSNNKCILRMVSTDELEWLWVDSGTSRTSLTTTTSNFGSGGSWMFVEFAWKASTNYREIFVNGSSIASSSATIGTFASAAVSLWFGDNLNINSCDIHYDHILATTDSTKSLYEARDQANYDNS